MALSKNAKIGIIALVVILGTGIPLTVIYWPDSGSPYDDYEITFTGLDSVVNVTYAELTDSTKYSSVTQDYFLENPYGSTEEVTIKGILLKTLIDDLNLDLSGVTGFRFVATDGYSTAYIPLEIFNAADDQFIVGWEEDGVVLKSEAEDGDGPLQMYVNRTFNYPMPNDPFCSKYFQEVRFETRPNFNLTIFGDGILDDNVTIPYGTLLTGKRFFAPKVYCGDYEYTNVTGGDVYNFTGAPLYGIINRTAALPLLDSYDNWNTLRFVNSTGHTSPWIEKDAISNPPDNEDAFLLAWEMNDADLPSGYLMSVVNSTAVIGPSSESHWLMNVNAIELGNIA